MSRAQCAQKSLLAVLIILGLAFQMSLMEMIFPPRRVSTVSSRVSNSDCKTYLVLFWTAGCLADWFKTFD